MLHQVLVFVAVWSVLVPLFIKEVFFLISSKLNIAPHTCAHNKQLQLSMVTLQSLVETVLQLFNFLA
jgi:hypothetical protein